MQNASSAGRKLTNEERVEVVKRQKKRNSFQLAMLSVIGIFGRPHCVADQLPCAGQGNL